ncbi:MAG: cation-translocating P-type ATPase, partial [Candidatus Hodarchaeota archaeon]
FINSIVIVIQQFRAQKALESLKKIAALKATVLREGLQSEILTRDLVPGDIILLEQGDKVPADARIIELMNFTVNEASLTGESEPVEKNNSVLPKKDLPIQEQTNMVFMSTYVDTGRCKALVIGTGINTEIGKISAQLNAMGSIEDIPLTRKLNSLGYILGFIAIFILFILITYKFIFLAIEGDFNEDSIGKALVSSILRSTNVVPFNLPLLSTLVLITGVLEIAQSGVIIKNLSAIESLGRVSVICSDKTGTITKNEMTIKKFWINNIEYEVTGSGYDAEGEILRDGNKINLNDNITFRKFIDSIVLNNNANLIYEDVKVRVKNMTEKAVRRALGAPTEASLLVLAEIAGYLTYDIKNKYEVLKEFSFDSELKRMTTICMANHSKNEIYAFSKGAPEKLITLCSQIEFNGKIQDINNDLKREILNRIELRANEGYRTLAIAYKKLLDNNYQDRDSIERNLIFLSFVSILDPPRVGVKESIEECQSGRIKVTIVTGDHSATAKTIAKQMGIFKEGDLVVEGYEIEALSIEDFNKVSVFARVEPTDKELIVENYQKQDKIVAMTGDGINDSPALKKAQAGIAMGITGTDLAKETSDMVISDDNFTAIVKGVKIGRGLFAKIRTIIYFFICLNIMEAFVFFTYEFIPFFDLFSSEWQHIYIFGIVHSLPSLALIIDTYPKDIMQDPPRDEEELLNKNMWMLLLMQAFLMGIGLVLVLQLTINGMIPLNDWNLNPDLSYLVSDSDEWITQKARTMFITTLYIAETNFIWAFRRPNKSILKTLKEELSIAVLLVCLFTLGFHILHICFSYKVNYYINEVSGLNFQINFMFLSGLDWLICVLFALPGIVGIELVKYFARNKNITF